MPQTTNSRIKKFNQDIVKQLHDINSKLIHLNIKIDEIPRAIQNTTETKERRKRCWNHLIYICPN